MTLPPQHELIAQQMERKELTQADLTRELKIQRSNMSNILSGKRTLPHSKIKQASDLLDIDEDVLYLSGGDLPPDIIQTILNHPKLVSVIRKHGALMRVAGVSS